MKSATAAIICLLASGLMASAHGTHDDRIAHFIQVIKNNPADVAARHDLARAYVDHGDWELALVELDRADAIKKGPDSSLTRARALAIGGRSVEARQVLDSFLKSSPDHPAALLERARIPDSLGNPGLSLADYRRTLELTEDPEPDLFIEVADQLVKQNLTKEAITVMHNSIATKGQLPSLVLKTMDLEIAAGLHDEALKRIDTMAALMPRPEPWMAKRADILARTGRMDESKQEWQALLDHLQALPAHERESVAMTNLSTQARRALAGTQEK